MKNTLDFAAVLLGITTLLMVAVAAFGDVAGNAGPADADGNNLAVVAAASTSYVSGHETLGSLNDGATPTDSADHAAGIYGNYPRRGEQWVQLTWAKPVTTDRAAVYWFEDTRGIRCPVSAQLLYQDGGTWKPVRSRTHAGGQIGAAKDQFNVLQFDPVKTTALRLVMVGRDQFSTGVIEWRVFDEGSSPAFAPLLDAGPDRTAVAGGRTYLNATAKGTGKPGAAVSWSKASGPGDVTFADATALKTSATLSEPGDYVLRLRGGSGEDVAADELAVHVRPASPPANLRPVDTQQYALHSAFWQPRMKNLIVNWIPHVVAKCEEPDLPEGGLNNIIEAGKKLRGEPYEAHVGYPFSNAWVLNTVEAMADAQLYDAQGDADILAAQAAMRRTLDDWIPLLLAAQEPDGYFQTRFTLGRENERGQRLPHWDPSYRREHEGYVAGYFIDAAVAHYLSTGGKDRRLYDAAIRLADCWNEHIGPAPKQPWFDGHQGMEIALLRLARLVNEVDGQGAGEKYADLAKFLLDCRGVSGQSEGKYDQSHLPVVQQYTAEGHAVRAAYNYAAMAEVARRRRDRPYQSAVFSIWDNLVNRKLYVTGGLGSGETAEGFGEDYSLPNNAYCESCAGVGELFFQQQMNLLTGDARYVDLYEDTLYNAILSDIDLDGQNFTYTNSLDTDQMRYKWHKCPCCVGNIPRAMLTLPTWTYATADDGLYVNLYVGSTMTVPGVVGGDLTVEQETDYPRGGDVKLTLRPATPAQFAVRLRVPERGVSDLYRGTPAASGVTAVRVNGELINAPEIEAGYVVLRRTWKAGDTIGLELPMPVQRVRAADAVASDRGRVALRRGPLLFNFEAADQDPNGVLPPTAPLRAEFDPDLLGGVMTIRGTFADGSPMLAIPNYARNNRGGRSVVWIRERAD